MGRKQKPEWIPAVDTSLNQKNKKKDIQKKKKNSRSKSNSPSSFRTERRNTPLKIQEVDLVHRQRPRTHPNHMKLLKVRFGVCTATRKQKEKKRKRIMKI